MPWGLGWVTRLKIIKIILYLAHGEITFLTLHNRNLCKLINFTI